MDALEGKKVTVVGLGSRTGVALVRYLCSEGAHVTAYDRQGREALADRLTELQGLSFREDFGREAPADLSNADLVLVSPGVPIHAPYLQESIRAGKKVWSEIEFAARRISAPIVAITGTNGKSTTTTLVAHLLRSFGKNVFCGGNLGAPLITAVGQKLDFVVAEVSSFQLEAVSSFHPRVAVLLNISPNHLDRHGDMKSYVEAKARLFVNMGKKDRAIVNGGQAVCLEITRRLPGIPLWKFSSSHENENAFMRGDHVVFDDGRTVSLQGLRLEGSHNQENAMAALLAARACGFTLDRAQEALQTYTPLPHRLETIATIHGVRFVNDSKSTTPESTLSAIQAFREPVILMAGGRSKGTSFDDLAVRATGKLKSALLFGEAAPAMADAFGERTRTEVFSTMKEAFQASLRRCEAGDLILLSPANSSFDQFSGFEERGNAFRSYVLDYMKGTLKA